MLHNTQAKPSATCLTRPSFIHPIKTLEKMREMLLWNTVSVIRNGAMHFSRLRLEHGLQSDRSKLWRIAKNVFYKIIQNLIDSITIKRKPVCGLVDLYFNFLLIKIKPTGITFSDFFKKRSKGLLCPLNYKRPRL
tara:strand:- start:16 stop:420 length:405 start_codon:yes stop_codon:yes gene_type:complete